MGKVRGHALLLTGPGQLGGFTASESLGLLPAMEARQAGCECVGISRTVQLIDIDIASESFEHADQEKIASRIQA